MNPRAEQSLLVVDAANVIGARPDGWWRDRAGAARRLVSVLSDRLSAEIGVVVVLEGSARAGVEAGRSDGARVVHAAGSGDDAVVAVVADEVDAEEGRPVTVVTADRGLRTRVQALGAQTVGPTWLWHRIEVGD